MSGILAQPNQRRRRPDTEPVEAATARLSRTRNKHGIWDIHYSTVDPSRPGGRRTKISSAKTGNRLEAEERLREFQAVYRGQAVASAKVTPTFEVIAREYVGHLERQGKSHCMRDALKWPRAWWGDKLPEDLNSALIEEYEDRRRAHMRDKVGSGHRGDYSQSTFNLEIGAVRTALNWARKRRMIGEHELPQDFDVPKRGPSRKVCLDDDAEARLFATAKAMVLAPEDPRYPSRREAALFVCIALETATRWTAAMELTWDRINLDAGMIDFECPGQRLTAKRRVGAMPISADLRPILEHAKARAGNPAHGRVFQTQPRKAFQRLLAQLGLGRRVTPHALRHTAATKKVAAGASVLEVAALLGNSPAVVSAVYLHPGAQHLLTAINRTPRS